MKEIILYNLKETVTEHQYEEYCRSKKGPFFAGLPSCRNFTLVKIAGSLSGQVPYRYIGIVDISSPSEWEQDARSPAFQDFFKEWREMVAEFHVLWGEEVGVWQSGKGS